MTAKDDDLLIQMKLLWAKLQEEQQRDWNRSLPFGEGLVDRWERAALLGFGPGASIYDSAVVIGDVEVGEGTWIGPNTVLDGSGGLVIGDYCSISAGVQIYSHNTVEWAVSGGQVEPRRAPTRIANRCYIGPNTVVEAGVSIGEGCIIGAFSLVKTSIPPGRRAWGQPCHVRD